MDAHQKKRHSGYRMHLFVAGDEVNSRRARENLRSICSQHLTDDCEVVITDVLQDYRIAQQMGIFITPALIVERPGDSVTLYGNMNDTARVLAALALDGDAE
jgi:circadian clock protein KaiB